MKIGTIDLGERPVFLAPMEDVTDISFRLMCKRFGADMVYTEFVSADALIRSVNKTQQNAERCRQKSVPSPPDIWPRGSDNGRCRTDLRAAHPDILDINFGARSTGGRQVQAPGYACTHPAVLEITREVVKAVNIPVTVKTRLGWDADNRIIVDLAEQLQDCGIAALSIHGRTRAQMYTGEADWTLIGEVKKNPRMQIPIIGNGDVTSAEICKQRFEQQGVDAVMIGPGSIGRPWIFREVKHYLNTGELLPAESFSWYLDILKKQVEQSVERLDERRGILHIRRHLAATPLFKGIADFKQTRVAMLRAETVEELFGILNSIPDKFQIGSGFQSDSKVPESIGY